MSLDFVAHNANMLELDTEFKKRGYNLNRDELLHAAKVIDHKYLWQILLDADLQPRPGKTYGHVIEAYISDNLAEEPAPSC